MFDLPMSVLESYIEEDLPFDDLTVSLQEAAGAHARLEIFTRNACTVSLTQEAARIAEHFDCRTVSAMPSGAQARQNDCILAYDGAYANIHKAWKLTQILLEYACGISTYTHKMLSKIRTESEFCALLGTRKTFPFAKKLCIKALLAGGGGIHRLNLSDSVLFFAQHRALYQSDGDFYARLDGFARKMPEKKIGVEALSLQDALGLLEHGAGLIQLDKFNPQDVEAVVKARNEAGKNATIVCAGGINLENAALYAKTGVDAIITSAMYFAPPADLSARLSLIR